MAVRELLMLLLMFLVFGSLAVGIAARLMIGPLVDAVLRLRAAFAVEPEPAVSGRRLAELEGEVWDLLRSVARLEEAEFERRRREGAAALPKDVRPGSRP